MPAQWQLWNENTCSRTRNTTWLRILLGANINFMFVNFFYFELDYFTRICINSKAFRSRIKCGEKKEEKQKKIQ